jgi:hypothetical protein
MFSFCAISVVVLLFSFGLVLWQRGYRELNGDDEGIRMAWISAIVAFCGGLFAFLFEWRNWQQVSLLFCFFLFVLAVGAFQLGLVGQALANGYIRAEGDEGRGIAATSLFTLLIMPTGETISNKDRPARFWFEILGRAILGLSLILFPTLAPIYRSLTR